MGGCLEKLFQSGDATTRKGRPEIQLLTPNVEANTSCEPAINKWGPVADGKLIAIHDYEARNEEELSFEKSEEFIPVTCEGDWWLVRSRKTDKQGYAPRNFIAAAGSLQCEEWFYGTITRKESERLLTRPQNSKGSYLIRESETSKSSFSLSILNEDPEHGMYVKHYRIHTDDNGAYYITESIQFKDLMGLVKFYEGGSNGLCCKLEKCCSVREVPQTLSIARNVFEIEESDLRRVEILEDDPSAGDIYKCVYNGKMAVSVKTSKMKHTDENLNDLKKLHHRSILKLFGVVRTAFPASYVWEHMHQGTLLHYLRKGQGAQSTLTDQIEIAAQVASGMAYLESVNFPHGLLRAVSVAVTEGPIFKVYDYGVGMQPDTSDSSDAPQGDPLHLWLSPEALQESRYGIKADVWSFGVVVIEILTKGKSPYSPMQQELEDVNHLLGKLNNGYRIARPEECPDVLYELLLQCWDAKDELRPTFEYLQIFLESFFQRNDVEKSKHIDHH